MGAFAHSLPILLNVGIAGLVFALGLNALPKDAAFLWRRPGLLLRSLVAMDVAVPAAAVLLVLALRPPRAAAIGILAMALAPGAPFAPQQGLRLGGRLPYVYSLLVTVAFLTVVTIPSTLQILGAIFVSDREAWVTPGQVAEVAVLMLVLPLVLGMLVRRALPALAARVARPLALAANLLLGAIVLFILVKAFPAILALDARAFAAMALLTFITLVCGHLLGGPEPEDRTALAVASSLRHPGLAMLVAKVNFPGEPVAAVVLAYMLVAGLASIPYTVWRQRRRAAARRQPPPLLAPTNSARRL
jgi:BASS family bile acid:Na+ symporter